MVNPAAEKRASSMELHRGYVARYKNSSLVHGRNAFNYTHSGEHWCDIFGLWLRSLQSAGKMPPRLDRLLVFDKLKLGVARSGTMENDAGVAERSGHRPQGHMLLKPVFRLSTRPSPQSSYTTGPEPLAFEICLVSALFVIMRRSCGAINSL